MNAQNILKSLTPLAIMFFLTSCGKTENKLSKQELTQYIGNKKNGLVKDQEINGTRVRLSYQPACILVTQELEDGQKNDSTIIKKLEEKYNSHYYFLLRFSRNGKEAIRELGSFSSYSDMVQVLSFQMANFVNLTTVQKDTVMLADYLFDQTYGMSDANTVLLSFEKSKIEKSKSIEINIGECGFRTGAMKFILNKEDIDKMPELDYNRL
jgi:hypothetical protein